MNTTKKSLLALSLIAAVPMQTQAFECPDFYDLAKTTFLGVTGAGFAYYQFHNPVAYDTKVPFERVLRGNYDNIIEDTFNMENVDSWYRIWPGQKGKVDAIAFETREGEKAMLCVGAYKKPISGEGVYYWCEKNMKGAVKWAVVMAILYALMYENLDLTTRKALELLLDGFGIAKKAAKGDFIPVPQQA
jgi:hypothetical protein